MRDGGFRTGASRARPARDCGRARRRLAALLPLAAAALLPAALAQSAGVSIGATSLSLTEGGTATYTTVLDIAPAASCMVQVQARSNNADVTVESPLAKTLSFTPSTWGSTAQTVTVSGLHDADGACYASGYYTRSEGTSTSPISIASVPVLVDDDESADTVTVSITSTPANGTHYVAGEVITRLSGFAPIESGAIQQAQMKFTVGGAERRTRGTKTFRSPAMLAFRSDHVPPEGKHRASLAPPQPRRYIAAPETWPSTVALRAWKHGG